MPYNAETDVATGQANTPSYDRLDDYYKASAGTPIWGWLSGADAAVSQAHGEDAAAQNRAYWDRLRAPGEGDLMGPTEDRDAQLQALNQLGQFSTGQLTGVDQQNLAMQRSRDEQQGAAQAGAIQQQANARGVGGSGLEFASQLANSQAQQGRSSDAETQMLGAAQQRGLQASGALASAAGNLRSQDVNATQQSFEDAAQRAAGATGQYSTDVGAQRSREQQNAQQNQNELNGLGQLINAAAA